MAKKKKKASYNPVSYVKPTAPGSYTSAYADQLTDARNNVLNFKYDPLQDASYQALAKIYGARGNQAAQDTLGEAASLNGGFGTSYAVSAAQQARNQYNQELAAMIPDLEANAFSRAQTTYGTLMDADNTDYSRYRDLVADYQWGKGYDTDVYWQKKSSAGRGGGGRRRSSGGGGGYSSSGVSSGSGMPISQSDYNKILNQNKKKKVTSGAGGGNSARVNKKVMMTR